MELEGSPWSPFNQARARTFSQKKSELNRLRRWRMVNPYYHVVHCAGSYSAVLRPRERGYRGGTYLLARRTPMQSTGAESSTAWRRGHGGGNGCGRRPAALAGGERMLETANGDSAPSGQSTARLTHLPTAGARHQRPKSRQHSASERASCETIGRRVPSPRPCRQLVKQTTPSSGTATLRAIPRNWWPKETQRKEVETGNG